MQYDEGTSTTKGLHEPPLGKDLLQLVLNHGTLQNIIPDYEARRATAARDAIASVESFPRCPECNCDCSRQAQPCQDVFGSNAELEGGVFGRVDAIYGSIEAQ